MCENSPRCRESLPSRALAALSPLAKHTGPTDHWCHNPSRVVLPLEHGTGKAFLAAGICGQFCLLHAQMGHHRQVFPKGGRRALCRASRQLQLEIAQAEEMHPCSSSHAFPECSIQVRNKAHHPHLHPTAHNQTVPSTSTDPQRYLWKHPMVSAGRFLLGARKEGKKDEECRNRSLCFPALSHAAN